MIVLSAIYDIYSWFLKLPFLAISSFSKVAKDDILSAAKNV